MVVMGVWAFILCTGHRWRKTKEQQPSNNSKQIFHEHKTKKSFALRHLCPINEVLSALWNPLISGQIVNSFGQGKCTFDCQSAFQKLFLSQTCLNKVMHVENWETDQLQHDLYVDISTNSLLHGYLFLMHVHKYCEHFRINDLVLFTRIIQWEGTAYSIIIINTILLNCILNDIATCNFYFSVSDYVCTILLKTISCQVWLSYMPTLPDTTTISQIKSSYELFCAAALNFSRRSAEEFRLKIEDFQPLVVLVVLCHQNGKLLLTHRL